MHNFYNIMLHVVLIQHPCTFLFWFVGGGIGFNNWNRRWFVLYGKTLSYYKKSSDAKPLNVIDLTKSRGVRNVDQCSCAWPKPFNLDVCFGLAVEGRTFYFNAETEEGLQ